MVVAKWNLIMKSQLDVADPTAIYVDEFQMEPHEGELQPDSKKTVSLTFSPRSEKVFNKKFVIRIPPDRKFTITARGQGTSVNLSISKDKLTIGPVLPYDDNIYIPIDITNTSEYDNEFYCLETDKQYTDEER